MKGRSEMKQQKLNSGEYGRIIDTINTLVQSLKNVELKEAIDNLFSLYGERFFAAPASTKLEFHNCFPGGLAEHSLRVYAILKDLAETYGKEIDPDSLIVTALLHDLGKMGNETEPFYKRKNSKWHETKLGLFYEINKDLLYLDHAHLSLYMLQKHNVPLSQEEFQAIITHDGPYIPGYESYKFKTCGLADLLHQADLIATKMEKQNWIKLNEG